MSEILSSEILLEAYCTGFFPMAESEDEQIYWHFPDERAIFPLDKIKIPRSMKSFIRKNSFKITINYDFEYVIRQCSIREDTWLSEELIQSYLELNRIGYAHSIEVWRDDSIVGGLYGVAFGGAFFGESMFNLLPNYSKIAFYFLVGHLKQQGFVLLDSQYINHFTEQLGAIVISRDDYLKRLNYAISLERFFA